MVVSRAARDVHAKFLLRNGADEIVYPEKQMALWTAMRYSSDHILDYIELDEEHAVVEITVPAEWQGKDRRQSGHTEKIQHQHHGSKKQGTINLTITPDTRFSEDESLLILGSNKAIQSVFGFDGSSLRERKFRGDVLK